MQGFNVYTPSAKFLPKSFALLNHRPYNLPWWDQILDPRSEFVTKWNNFFVVACLVTLFLDPLYFFVPYMCGTACLCSNLAISVTVTFFRTVTDCFYLLHILFKFRTSFVAPNSRVYGRRELVTDPTSIALRYLKTDFIIDLAAMLPLPQIVVWFVVPALKSTSFHTNHTLSLIVLIQYVPRMFVMFPLNQKIVNSTGVVARTAWSGAAYNVLLLILASHVLGAIWYIWSIQRLHTCWMIECKNDWNVTHFPCDPSFFESKSLDLPARKVWLNGTHVLASCDPREDVNFKFGLFADALVDDVPSAGFFEAYFYCLWWGLKSLSAYGQNLANSTYVGETVFCSSICILGLFLFSHLIGQVQTYLQSIMVRIEEWRIKRRDTEEWMRHRQLPEELKECIRRFVQYKWLATRGVDEESILQSLPLDLRREIQRHLCLGLVRRVPFFAQMDDQLLDAICERLVSSLSTKGTYMIREGDPVTEMFFIIRGQLESSTTYGGRSGFYNSITLRLGDFCGEELLTWALLPTSTLNLPSSTRTVKALTEVEAFALQADDLKFVATQFKRLHSKKLQHAFRYYSHQWRTWGACFIQAAWRRYKKRRMAEELARHESYYYYMQAADRESTYSDDPLLIMDYEDDDGVGSSAANPLGTTFLASKFAANTRRGVNQKVKIVEPSPESLKMPKMFKPEDPDFYADI